MSMGSDLLLLAVEDKSGRVRSRPALGVALAAADLVELVLAGYVTLRGDLLTVMPEDAPDGPSGAVLRTLADNARPVTIAQSLSDRAISAFSAHLQEAKQSRLLVEAPRTSNENYTPLTVLEKERATAAAQRFAAVARAGAAPAAGDTSALADLAYALLADAVGFTRVHLGGPFNRKVRTWLAAQADQRAGEQEPERTIRAIVRAARRRIEQMDRSSYSTVPQSSDQFGGMPPGTRF